MRNSVDRGTLAAVVKTATFLSTTKIKYTTEDPHNFNVGQSLTVTGITGGTSANVSGLLIVNIPTVNSFIVSAASGSTFATGTAPVVGTGSSAVTAWATNSWANLYNITYAMPEPVNILPYYLDITSNIMAETVTPYPTDGSVSVKLNWSSSGGSNPLASYLVTQTVGTTTTTISTAPVGSNIVVTGLTADAVYTFGINATNVYSTTGSLKTVSISVPKYLSGMVSITASATASTAQSITVSWVKPVTASPPISTFELEVATRSLVTDPWSSWSVLSTSISGTTTSYVHSSLGASTRYKYRIRAYNGLYTEYLESSEVRPNFITSPMTTPTLSYDSPGLTKNIRIDVASFASIPSASSWQIERSTTGTNGWSVIATAATSTIVSDTSARFVDSTVALSTTYYYRLAATNGQLTSTVSSASAGITTYSVPNAPTSVAAAQRVGSGTEIDITWVAATVASGSPAVSNYQIEQSLTGTNGWSVLSSAISPSATTYTDGGRSLGVTYYYRLSAINAVGTSALSSTVNATITAIAPTAPTNLTATAISGGGSISLSWSAPTFNGGSAITSYTISRGATQSTATQIATTASNVTTFTDTGLTPATAYTYTVFATNIAGTSPTATVNTATSAGVPSAPVLYANGSTGGSNETAATFSFYWSVPANNGSAITGYKTEYLDGSGVGWYTLETFGASTTGATYGVDVGGGFTIRVRALNAVGYGPPSNEGGGSFYYDQYNQPYVPRDD